MLELTAVVDTLWNLCQDQTSTFPESVVWDTLGSTAPGGNRGFLVGGGPGP